MTTRVPRRNFGELVFIGDIVAVNGQPAKGTWVGRSSEIIQNPNPQPGQAISDINRSVVTQNAFEILQPDGTPIGTIMVNGLGAGPRPPGAPLVSTGSNQVVVGGTGAFLGARGQMGSARVAQERPPASVTEDPGNRRTLSGGTRRLVVHLIPLSRPETVTTPSGPAVFQADMSQVTAVNPARAGEVLILTATHLGPTRPGVDPGQPFPESPLQVVNSPVEVKVNGQAAEVVSKVGVPGAVNTYRVEFRVPEGTAAGTATVQLSAAWIAGPEVQIPVSLMN